MSEYVVVIEDAGRNFAAYVPDIPGCITTGATVEEAVVNMREALELHFDGLRARGMPIPPPSTRAALVEAA